MKPIYDLAQKISGLAAFCGTDIMDTDIAYVIFGHEMNEQRSREAYSKLKAAVRVPSIEDRTKLSSHFNGLIANVARRNDPSEQAGPIRPEDWDQPLTVFFAELERHFGEYADRLDRAHSAIVASLLAMDEFRSTTMPLALTNHVGQSRDIGRFPSNAIGVDTITLPTIQFRHGERMMIEITRPLDHAVQAWMFFIRNPDTRKSSRGIINRIWSQKPENLIRWSASPFMLKEGFTGALPGFPCTVEALDGEYTAYLLLEEAGALGVRRCLESEMGNSWNPNGPTYEATLHMISRVRTLFQRGNKAKLDYPPPSLLMRRYRIWNG
jgi:hypothetical protein